MPPPNNRLALPARNAMVEPQPISQQELIARLVPPLAIPMGISSGMQRNLKGTVQAVTDPVGMMRNIYEAGVRLGKNPMEILTALREARQKFMSGPFAASQMLAENISVPRVPRPNVMRELDVYHGTPHRFPPTPNNPLGEFDASKIGTGEGAQAYGHGIYLAENPRVAGEYQKMEANVLQSPVRTFKGQELQAGSPEYHAATLVDSMGLNKARKEVANWIATADPRMTREVEGWKQTLNTLNAATGKSDFKATASKGALYKADLPDEMIDRMLDWDKRISDQPDIIKAAWQSWQQSKEAQKLKKQLMNQGRSQTEVEKMFANPTGQTMHGWIYEGYGSAEGGEKPKVAKFLQSQGVLGVKYEDAGSRGQGGTGTQNFVVFPGEEKKVRILERK